MTVEEWHSFLERYHSTLKLAEEEYGGWLQEFEAEHGEQAREAFEESRLM